MRTPNGRRSNTMLKMKSEVPLDYPKILRIFLPALKIWTTAMPTPAKLNLRKNVNFQIL